MIILSLKEVYQFSYYISLIDNLQFLLLFWFNYQKVKDKRYKIVKSLITTNELAKFADIFSVIPISVVAKDTGSNYSTLHKKIHNTRYLNLNDFSAMANLFDIDILELVKLAVKSMPKSAKG